jgi:hypothetical protein
LSIFFLLGTGPSQQSAQLGAHTPLPMQQQQQLCFVEMVPLATSSVEPPQQQHEQASSGVLGGQQAILRSRAKAKMQRTGIAKNGFTTAKVRTPQRAVTLRPLCKRHCFCQFLLPLGCIVAKI